MSKEIKEKKVTKTRAKKTTMPKQLIDETLNEIKEKEDIVVKEEKYVEAQVRAKVSSSIVREFEYQLRIHENLLLNPPKHCKKVRVKNVGGGDVFVAEDVQGIFNPKARLAEGRIREYEGAVRVTSGSRPTIKVTYMT